MTGELIWQKSSFSGGDNNQACVEIAHASHLIAIRESDTPDDVITTTAGHLRMLISGVKSGRLDDLI
ncbi:DUF397 domain-containing protein [Streptomyces sp. SCA3-4]|uniref:DUF397 domain-containing protein n=1 Tax=Streptomyces sichuanensis TaxID=2871810 RepID=UPI001CE2BB34|nr:DUF397 domain-containing protein [Streptomyces sichuanensis]MCA6090928.1 DUF397 domain-containing protein [Streptomyces sichuanensis]